MRPMRPDERAFVLDSWIRSYYDGSTSYLRWISKPAFCALYDDVCRKLTRDCQVMVEPAPGDDEIIAGWACSEQGGLHYVYVREAYRRAGIASALIAGKDAESWYSHETWSGKRLLRGLSLEWQHRPEKLESHYDLRSFARHSTASMGGHALARGATLPEVTYR